MGFPIGGQEFMLFLSLVTANGVLFKNKIHQQPFCALLGKIQNMVGGVTCHKQRQPALSRFLYP